jgi:hypothetical protein
LGALFALIPPTADFAGLLAFAALCCAFGGVPTIEGGDFGDSGVLAEGWLDCSDVVSCGIVS